MLFLHDYIKQFRDNGSAERLELADVLEETKHGYDIHAGGDPIDSFEEFVARYNWLGTRQNKLKYQIDQNLIDQNLARNLPGALMQDFLVHLAIKLCEDHPTLDVFTEVRVRFGKYPLWLSGQVKVKQPAEKSDLAIGYLSLDDEISPATDTWPREPYYKLEGNQAVVPLVTVNSKIRVSQSEFFDWLGRSQLMARGNPHCLSLQVALRKEMDMDIVEAAQSSPRFFLLGTGTETNVTPSRSELERLVFTIKKHLADRMGTA